MKQFIAAIAVLLCLLCSSNCLQAEDPAKAEVFGGFSILSVEGVQGLGWQAAAQGNLNKNIGIVADAGGHYKFHISAYEFLFGPRFSTRGTRKTAFAHALLGTARLQAFRDSVSSFAVGIGGGIDVNASDRIAVRVFQLDWLPSRFEGGWQKRNARVGFGLVFKAGL
jgi:hypothetical protein